MLAWFLARAPPTSSLHPASLPAPGDPPHAAPYSPLYSPGSMPSDVDMHGGIGSSEESSDACQSPSDENYPSVADTGLGLSGFGQLMSPPRSQAEASSAAYASEEAPQPDVSHDSSSEADDSAAQRTPRGGSGLRQSRPLNTPTSSTYFQSVTMESTTTTTHTSSTSAPFEQEFRSVPLTLPGASLRIAVPENAESSFTRGRTLQTAPPLWWTRRDEETVTPADVSQSDRLDHVSTSAV